MGTVRIAATGDAIVTHRIAINASQEFTDLVKILRAADATITNVEMVFPGTDRHPSTTMHGTPLGVEPDMLSELEWLGVDLYGMANNHATDYGTDGLVASIEELERRRLPYAGVGRTLREARAPRYLDTPDGRVALVAAGSSNARLSAAADPGIGDAGRAGISPIRLVKTHYVARERFDEFRRILADTGVDVASRGTTAPGIHFPYPDRNIYEPPPPDGLAIEGVHFAPADTPRVQTDALEADVEALQRVVAEASRQADIVVASLHCHEGIQGGWNSEMPAEFLRPLAHSLIESGANAVVAHGPHMLRGVEIHRGRPICYSLGNFIFNLEAIPSFPVEVYLQQGMSPDSTPADLYDIVTGYVDEPRFWESVVAQFTFSNGELTKTELTPIVLGRDQPRSRRGCPTLTSAERGAEILDRLRSLSTDFGADIEIERHGSSVVGRILK